MKIPSKNIILYMMIVLLPSTLFTVYYANEINQRDKAERYKHAEWIAAIHEEHWDSLISESVTIMDMLSMTAITMQDTPEKMAPLLQKTNQSDPRYGGIYLLDEDGDVLTGVNPLLTNTNLSKNSYVQETIRSKDTIISDQPETLSNDQHVVGLAKPVLDENGSLISIIIAYLRIDYIQNVLEMITPDEHITITNSNDETIMHINYSGSKKETEQFYSLPINRIPWVIHAMIPEENQAQIRWEMIQFSILAIIISHIVFLLINYIILRRQAAHEKKQNELHKLELVGTFAASTAHEIRNPLTGIKGLVQLLGEKYTSEKDQIYFSVINQEINRINEIVSEFMILGKPTALKTETLDMRNIIIELELLIQNEANTKSQNCQIILPEKPLYVDCTKDQMKQVILNIIKNAIESMGDAGNLTVVLKQTSNKCQLTVSDTGIGISPKEMKKIFNPFFTSKVTGTGLGLVICKRIIDSFGGNISISSKVNEGTTVTITLPIVDPP